LVTAYADTVTAVSDVAAVTTCTVAAAYADTLTLICIFFYHSYICIFRPNLNTYSGST
jgi:hypothetical protein